MLGDNPVDFLKEFFIVSQVEIKTSPTGLQETPIKGLFALVDHAQGHKCPRCWNWDTVVDARGLDRRCVDVLGK